MKKIFGNWSNEHGARFNANLSIVILCAAILIFYGSYLTWIAVAVFGATSLVQMFAAAYYYLHPGKWEEIHMKP